MVDRGRAMERGRGTADEGEARPRPIFRLRERTMYPARGGDQLELTWLQFTGSVQLRLALPDLDGLQNSDFEVRASRTELSVTSRRSSAAEDDNLGVVLKSVNGKLTGEIKPKDCWYNVEADLYKKHTVLVIELVKVHCTKAWTSVFLDSQRFKRTPSQRMNEDLEAQGLLLVKDGRRSDVEDEYVNVPRGFLCVELYQYQTAKDLTFRVILDQKKLDDAVERVPYYKLFGADISEKSFKLFIRGDESSPILMGELGGRVLPDYTTLDITTLEREVEGHRIRGTMETLPCLDVTLVKARDSQGEWEELLSEDEEVLNAPQGSLEEYEMKQLQRQLKRDPSPDLEDKMPDDFAFEEKEKANAAFKAESYRDAIVYYTRALRWTPGDEKLLCNRSAAYLKIMKFQLALDDAESSERINPDFAKVYFRKGNALRGLKRFEDACIAFETGKDIDPGNPEWDREISRTKAQKVALEDRRKAKGK